MKQQQKLSNEGSLSSNNPQVLDNTLECDGLDETFETVTSENMMADSSFNASLTTNMKMLMPHELGASNSVVGAASLVGQHSLHGSSSFYHHSVGTASNSNIVSGFNGFHNTTFSSYSPHNSLNGMGTTSSFSNLVHQQPITLSSNHSLTISSTMPPPLIPYHQPFYTSSSNILSTSTITATNEIENRQQNKTSENVNVNNKTTPVSEIEEQTGATSTDLITDENMEISNETGQETEEPEIDIVISNVVCAFSVRCHLSLKEIALHGSNVEYKRENGMVTMKLRKPFTTASIWSSGVYFFIKCIKIYLYIFTLYIFLGKVTCTGATSEEQAKIAARRTARMLQKLNFKVRFHNYRVVNVLGTCKMPWAIKIVQFSEKYKKEASYEPELHPGVTYNLKNPTATLKIFSTGSMTVTGMQTLL